MGYFGDVRATWGNTSGGLNVTDLNKIVLRHMEHVHIKIEW